MHRAWQPAFSPASLSGYLGLMDASARKLTTMIEARAVAEAAATAAGGETAATGGETAVVGSRLDVHYELGRMTLQVGCRGKLEPAMLKLNPRYVARPTRNLAHDLTRPANPNPTHLSPPQN